MSTNSKKLLPAYGPLLVISGVALFLRIKHILDFRETPFFYHLSLDPLFYDQSALSILEGNYLLGNEVLHMGPLYSFFLTGIFAIFGHDLLTARIVQALIGTLSCLLIYLIGRKNFDRKTALTAAAIAALYGPFIFTEGNLISESLAIFTNLLVIVTLIEAHERESLLLWYLPGLFLGISAVIRPNILLFAPLAMVWIIFVSRLEGMAKTGLYCFLFFAGTITAIAPVTARNYLLTGDTVLITSSGGLNFYLGNNKNASGILTEPDFIRPDPAYEHSDAKREAQRRAGKKLKASESSAFWFGEGLRFIKENPFQYVNLLGNKLFFLSNAYEVPDNLNYDFIRNYSSVLGLPLIHYGIIFPLAVTGIVFAFPFWRRYLLLYLMTGSYILFLLLFFITSRYRLPLVPFLILFASFALYRLWHFVKDKKYYAAVFFLILLSFVFVFSNIVPQEEKRRFDAQSHDAMGSAYYQAEDLNAAVKEFERAVFLLPASPLISNNLAWAYAASGENLGKAKELSEFAVKMRPDNTGFLDTLAFVYYKMGRLRESEALLKKALSLEPGNARMKERLNNVKKGRFLY